MKYIENKYELNGMENGIFRIQYSFYRDIMVFNINSNECVFKTCSVDELKNYGFEVESFKEITFDNIHSVFSELDISAVLHKGQWYSARKTNKEDNPYDFSVIENLNDRLKRSGYYIINKKIKIDKTVEN